jgi:hypothetical protein
VVNTHYPWCDEDIRDNEHKDMSPFLRWIYGQFAWYVPFVFLSAFFGFFWGQRIRRGLNEQLFVFPPTTICTLGVLILF